jgi:Tol biopolymer transport system component
LNEATPAALADIRLLTMTPTPQVKPLVETRFDERGGVVSPDGRWLAYESNRSGAMKPMSSRFQPSIVVGRSRPAAERSRSGRGAGGSSSMWRLTAR